MRQNTLKLVARAVRVTEEGAEATERKPRVRHDPRQRGRDHHALVLPLRARDERIVKGEDLERRRVDGERGRQAEAKVVGLLLRHRVVKALEVVEGAIGPLDGLLQRDVRFRVLPGVLQLLRRRGCRRIPLDGQFRSAAPPVGTELTARARFGLRFRRQHALLDVVAEDGLGVEKRSQCLENRLELSAQMDRHGPRQLPVVAQASEGDRRLDRELQDGGFRLRRSLAVRFRGRPGFTFPSQVPSPSRPPVRQGRHGRSVQII